MGVTRAGADLPLAGDHAKLSCDFEENAMTALPGPARNSKRDTISRLLTVAKREFGAKGLDGARVDDIARAAGVTKQLVYYYYRSKDELFASILDETAAIAMAEMVALELEHLPPPQALRVFLHQVFEQYRRYPVLALTVIEENRQHGLHVSARNKFPDLTPEVVNKLRCVLDRGALSGDFRAGIDAPAFLAMSVLLTTGCFISGYCLSVMMDVDLGTTSGQLAWRDQAIEFVLAAVRARGHDHASGQGDMVWMLRASPA
jgi:AcrR family transcriptional regulator